MNVKGFINNLFVFTQKIVPSEEHYHFDLLDGVHKHLDKNTEILVSRITRNDIPTEECYNALMRLHKMGHVYVMSDTNFIALNVYTKNDSVMYKQIIELIDNPKSSIPKPRMCYNITHARYLDLAWNMTHQIHRYIDYESKIESTVKVGRFVDGTIRITEQKMRERMVDESSPWYEQVYKTISEQIEFMYFSDKLKQTQEIEEGIIFETKELYEVEMVKDEATTKRETSLVLVESR